MTSPLSQSRKRRPETIVTMRSSWSLDWRIHLNCIIRIPDQPGRAVLVKPNTMHRISTGGVTSIFVFIDPRSSLAYHLVKAFNKGAIVELGDTATLQLTAYFTKYLTHHFGDKEITRSLLEIITTSQNTNDQQADRKITQILLMINGVEQKSSLDFKQLVIDSGLSESRLMHYFKEETGVTIRKYIQWLRLQKAMRSIVLGISIKDIAIKMGFTDAAHFNRAFVSTFGINPSRIAYSSKRMK